MTKYQDNYEIVCFTEDASVKEIIDEAVIRLATDYNYQAFSGSLELAFDYITAGQAPKIIIVDCQTQDFLISNVEPLVEICPLETQIIIIGTENDVGVFRDLLYLDVADYLVKPLNSDLVLSSLNKGIGLSKRSPLTGYAKRSGKIINFIGTTGGVGNTMLAVNVACFLAETHHKRVLLIDADLQFGNVATMLGMSPSNALIEGINNLNHVDTTLLDNTSISYSKHLRIFSSESSLLSPLNTHAEDFIKNFYQLLAKVQQHFHYVLIDFSRQHSFLWMPAMQRSGRTFLTSELTPTSLRDTIRIANLFRTESSPPSIKVILNHRAVDYSLNPESFWQFLGEKPGISIPYEITAAEAVALGVPLINHTQSFQTHIDKITQLISGKNAAQLAQRPTNQRLSFSQLYKNLWSRNKA